MPELSDSQNKTQNPQMLSAQSPWKKWSGLGVLSLGLAIVIIDSTLLNVSLSTIIKDLNTNLQNIQWVITSYALILAAFTITGGRLGDLFGRKKMFMLGAIIFAAGSFIASISHNMPTLLIGESIIEGFGAALMLPATSSLVVANFHGKDRATAFGVWGGVAGASSAIGPLLGGYLTSHYSWRWGFRINVFVAIILVVGALALISDSRDKDHKPTLDFGGVVLSTLGLLGIVFGIIESETYGWWKAAHSLTLGGYQITLWGLSFVPFVIAFGIIIMTLFFLWERRVEKNGKIPLVSLALLNNAQFTSGALTVAFLSLGLTGLIFALPIFLESVKQLDAFHTGLALVSLSIALLIASPIAAALSKKISPKYLIQTGLIISVGAMFVLRAVMKSDVPVSHLIPGLVLFGVGMGMVQSNASNLTLSAVPVSMAGEASGVNNTLRQVGTSLGSAIIGAAMLTMIGTNITKGVQESPVIPDSLKSQITQNIASEGTNIEFGQPNIPSQVPQNIKREITGLINESITQAAKDSYIYAAMFLLLAFGVSLFLPKITVGENDEHGQTTTAESTNKSKGRTYALASLVAIIAVGGGIWLLHFSSSKSITTGAAASQDSVADIQKAFQPPAVVTTTSQNGAASTTTTVTAQNQNLTATPRGQSPAAPEIAPSSTPAASVALPVVYRNDSSGYQLTLPASWQAQTVSENEVSLVSQNGTSENIQTYDGVEESLDTIQAELQGSPSIAQTYSTTFQGQPAVGFTTKSGLTGVAIIHGTRLYYIMGPDLNSEPLSSFMFI